MVREIKKELKMSEMFKLLKEGLEGIIQHQKGKRKLKKRVVKVPKPAIQLCPFHRVKI